MFRSRHKAKNLVLILAGVLILLIVGMLLIFLKSITAPVSSSRVASEFVIEKGESARTIAMSLENQGLIRSSYAFRYALKKLGLSSKLQAGIYTLTPSMDAYEIARALTLGISDIKITIPEGYRLEQIGEVVETQLGIPARDFLAVGKGQEGYLFPDTYYVHQGATAEEVVKLMKANFSKKFPSVDQKTVILASLVERETKGKAEKPVVAGILLKRLSSGWPLELDATIQYVLGTKGDWWPNTTLADREKKSPYNTYLNQGLPPAPIGNPGADSIDAALHPQVSDYWFYLHDPAGMIHYAKTNAEHTANIQKYLYK